MVPIRALNSKGEQILKEIRVDARKQLYEHSKHIKGPRIAYLAVYHKDPLVRKKNMKRVLKTIEKRYMKRRF